tara:strand:- start:2954 stop:3727 length:774 start_codon:yes stop_codon:yes gene_type:complete
MAKFDIRLFDRALSARIMRRWADKAERAKTVDLVTLHKQSRRARKLKAYLDKLIHVAEERLAKPLVGSDKFSKPHNADWVWRPQIWRGPLPKPGISSAGSKSAVGDEVTLFHDCTLSEMGIRQLRNMREADLAPYGLRLEVYRFDGTFLSLVLELPKECTEGLARSHLLRLDAIIEKEQPIEIFARLNIRHGPNTEQIVRELPLDQKDITVEFDLAYTNLNEKRVEKAWIDLIFEGPEMNEIILRDLTFSRRPRAQL